MEVNIANTVTLLHCNGYWRVQHKDVAMEMCTQKEDCSTFIGGNIHSFRRFYLNASILVLFITRSFTV